MLVTASDIEKIDLLIAFDLTGSAFRFKPRTPRLGGRG
jgi:hypothetical protein